MAGRIMSMKDERKTTSDVLLHKLKEGQEKLRSSVRVLRQSDSWRKWEDGGGKKRGEKELAVHRYTGGRRGRGPLDCVENLPRKRARLLQLSPTTSSVVSSPPSSPSPTHMCLHSHRLSSTPKTTRSPPPSPPDPSLEEAIFEHGESRSGKMPQMPNPSRTMVDSSASRRKKRGLSVSFLQGDHSNRSAQCNDHDTEPQLSFTAEKDLGTSLIESLNSSRFGALDRRLSKMRKTRKFPRKYAGDDPKLGYDWIAGLLEAGSCLSEKDDEYFEEMKEFRRVNHSECVQPPEAMLPGSLVGEEKGSGRTLDTSTTTGDAECTTCVSSYVLNDRLFPIPVHDSSDPGWSHCPTCEGKHKRDPSPTRYVRVSVPRSSLQAPYKVRPHRRRSFNPTDSMGLSQHCLAGWETAKPSIVPPQSSIDLKSALSTKTGTRGESNRKRSHDLLNSSHSLEYDLRSRTAKKQKLGKL